MHNKKAAATITNVIQWNRTIIVTNVVEKPLTIVGDHSTLGGKSQVEKHFEQLAAAVKKVQKHNAHIAMLAVTAYLDKSLAQYSYLELCNSNNILLNDFVHELNLFAVTTSFQIKPGKL